MYISQQVVNALFGFPRLTPVGVLFNNEGPKSNLLIVELSAFVTNTRQLPLSFIACMPDGPFKFPMFPMLKAVGVFERLVVRSKRVTVLFEKFTVKPYQCPLSLKTYKS